MDKINAKPKFVRLHHAGVQPYKFGFALGSS